MRISYRAFLHSLVLQPQNPLTPLSPPLAPVVYNVKADFVLILPLGPSVPRTMSIVHHKSSVSCRRGDGQESYRESVCLGAFLASAGMMSSGTKPERGGASSPSESASPWVCLRRVCTPDMASACRDALGPPQFQNTCYSWDCPPGSEHLLGARQPVCPFPGLQ